MKSIGIRELRQHASRYLRDVERGETIEITDRGRPVARIVPTGEGDAVARLTSAGRLRPALRAPLDSAPLTPTADVELLARRCSTIAPMSAERPRRAIYLDSSAIVKLVVREPETDALLGFLEPGHLRVTSALARVEVVRAVRRHGRTATARARDVLDSLNLLVLDDALLDRAATIAADDLRSLDAIHIASAQQLDTQIHALVTYDDRMLTAAQTLGLPTARPAK